VTFLDALSRRVLVADGGMGTAIQALTPAPADFGNHPGLNEWLNLTRPDLVAGIHDAFLDAGCDLVETNSFSAFPVVLAAHEVAGRSRELAEAAARIARRCADRHATPGRPRFVAGSLGPGTRLPSRGQISFHELREAYRPLAAGLLAGGCDLLLVETCQDPLQARAALLACRDAMAAAGRVVPVGVQFTVAADGTLRAGTDLLAALDMLLPLSPAFVGLNCGTGPEALREPVRRLCRHSPVPVSVQPSAGLPRREGGRWVYDLTPARFAETVARLVEECGVGLVGGCCGTGPEHLAALVARVGGRARRPGTMDGGISGRAGNDGR